jgi:hypothetical protein
MANYTEINPNELDLNKVTGTPISAVSQTQVSDPQTYQEISPDQVDLSNVTTGTQAPPRTLPPIGRLVIPTGAGMQKAYAETNFGQAFDPIKGLGTGLTANLARLGAEQGGPMALAALLSGSALEKLGSIATPDSSFKKMYPTGSFYPKTGTEPSAPTPSIPDILSNFITGLTQDTGKTLGTIASGMFDPLTALLPAGAAKGTYAGMAKLAPQYTANLPKTAQAVQALSAGTVPPVIEAGAQQMVQSGSINPSELAKTAGVSALLSAPMAGISAATTRAPFKPLTDAQKTAMQFINEGGVMPPNVLLPTQTGKAITSIADQQSLAKQASDVNRLVVEDQARKVLDLPENTQLTKPAFIDFRKKQGEAYDALKKFDYSIDEPLFIRLKQVKDDLSLGYTNQKEIKTELSLLNDYINKQSYTGNELIEKIKTLRKNADINQDSMKPATDQRLGSVQKTIASELELYLDRNFSKLDPTDPNRNLYKNFDDARRKIAQSYTLQDATDLVTGQVDAGKLGAAAARGEPIPSQLASSAEASRVNRQYFQPMNLTSNQGIPKKDVATLGGTALLRDFLTSKTGQSLLSPPTAPLQPRLGGLLQSPLFPAVTPQAQYLLGNEYRP